MHNQIWYTKKIIAYCFIFCKQYVIYKEGYKNHNYRNKRIIDIDVDILFSSLFLIFFINKYNVIPIQK